MSANEKVPLNSRKIAAMPVQKPSFIDIRVHPISNKLVQVKIGNFPTISLAEARLNITRAKGA